MTLSMMGGAFAFVALTVPGVVLLVLGLALVLSRGLSEKRVHQLVSSAMSTGLAASIALALLLLLQGGGAVEIDLGSLLAVSGHHLDIGFRLDAPAVLMLFLDFLLCGLVGLFSNRYLHRDEGYHRFYALLLLFSVGVSMVAAARGLDLLFAGWELIGLSSALLIAFFHRRREPVRHGLRAYAVYRLTDIGLLMAVVLLHQALGSTDLARLSELPATGISLLVGGLLVFGAMGKGASLPFTGWLPRAMEGPTPSSAVFYGALSIHASPFLLLRITPLLEAHLGLRLAVIGIGLLTAFHASMAGRTQPDVKASLGYASVTQVGLIWAEIGLGLHTLALVHIGGHAVLRTWQLLRAPSLLLDRSRLSSLLGELPAARGSRFELLLPEKLRRPAYLFALERWYLDELLDWLVASISRPLQTLDAADRAWGRRLRGEPASRESVRPVVPPDPAAPEVRG